MFFNQKSFFVVQLCSLKWSVYPKQQLHALAHHLNIILAATAELFIDSRSVATLKNHELQPFYGSGNISLGTTTLRSSWWRLSPLNLYLRWHHWWNYCLCKAAVACQPHPVRISFTLCVSARACALVCGCVGLLSTMFSRKREVGSLLVSNVLIKCWTCEI